MTLETALTDFAEMLQANRATLWDLGDKLAAAREQFGPKVMGEFAAVARYSKRWCQKLASVSSTYSTDDRAEFADLNWSLFALAATQENPRHWLERAADEGWSESELRKAIRGEKPETPKVERLLKRVEKMLSDGGDDAAALQDGLLSLLRQV